MSERITLDHIMTNISALQVPVVGYLVQLDPTKCWTERNTITTRIQYDKDTDEWVMVEKGTQNSVVVFVTGERSEHAHFLRITSIGKNGQFVNAEMFESK